MKCPLTHQPYYDQKKFSKHVRSLITHVRSRDKITGRSPKERKRLRLERQRAVRLINDKCSVQGIVDEVNKNIGTLTQHPLMPGLNIVLPTIPEIGVVDEGKTEIVDNRLMHEVTINDIPRVAGWNYFLNIALLDAGLSVQKLGAGLEMPVFMIGIDLDKFHALNTVLRLSE